MIKGLFYGLVELSCLVVVCWFCYSLGVRETKANIVLQEQTSLCYDTKKAEAWVATKGSIKRCFMEQRGYPHRVRASHIEGEEE